MALTSSCVVIYVLGLIDRIVVLCCLYLHNVADQM